MNLPSRDVFKAVFVKTCRDAGITDAQIAEVSRRAQELLVKRAGAFMDLLNALNNRRIGIQKKKIQDVEGLGNYSKALGAAAIGLPFATGVGAGLLTSKVKGNYLDEDDVKNQEVVNELRRQTQLAKQQKRLNMASTT